MTLRLNARVTGTDRSCGHVQGAARTLFDYLAWARVVAPSHKAYHWVVAVGDASFMPLKLQAWGPVMVGAVNPVIVDTLEGMKKPLKCLLMFHEWRLRTNDEGQQFKICDRCGAYRDFTPAAGAS
jgi:hypothetical protein